MGTSSEPARVRVTVPGIDADALEAAVAARCDSFRTGMHAGNARAEHIEVITRALDDVVVRLAVAAERSAPRTQMPQRLQALQPLAPFILGAYNYISKSQRESSLEHTHALASLVSVVRLSLGAYED